VVATTSRAPAAVYYQNCDEVTAAGEAPLTKSEPGYRKALDRDGDGVACESDDSPPDTDEDTVYYKNCTAVRDDGAAPIHRGEPGYGKHLDRDGDGIACE
jgi:hypothetical protein